MKSPLIKSITKRDYIDGTVYRVRLDPPYDNYGAILKDNGQLDYIFNNRTGQRNAEKVAIQNLPQYLVDAFKSVELCVKASHNK